ncbi:unnamed protein product [Gadus morhua 'NCC']
MHAAAVGTGVRHSHYPLAIANGLFCYPCVLIHPDCCTTETPWTTTEQQQVAAGTTGKRRALGEQDKQRLSKEVCDTILGHANERCTPRHSVLEPGLTVTTARALLHKAAESNAFIREEVDAALGHMVRHCPPARCINAFLDGGLRTLVHDRGDGTLFSPVKW